MVKKNFLKSSLIVLVALAMVLPVIPTISLATTSKPSITYSAHMQTYGWDKANQKPGDALADEAKTFAGVTGESKRMEALEVNILPVNGEKLEYRAHVQGKGWMDWVTADSAANHDATVGTTGESLRVEALQLSLKGTEERNYSILYRAHVQGEGWMDWVDASDPKAFAGTTGRSLRMEAFEIAVVSSDDFRYIMNNNGTHTQYYKGTLSTPVECVFGDYTADGDTMTRKCALCGYSEETEETLKLNDVLNEARLEGQSKVTLDKVDSLSAALEIPAGVTLEVEGELNATENVTVKGHLVAKKIDVTSQKTVTCEGDGVITFSGRYGDTEGSALNDNLTFVTTHTQAKVDKIVLEKGSEKQTLSTKPEIPAGKELTLDLNGTTVESTTSGEADNVITNNGKLTINDGVFNFKGEEGRGIASTGANSELVVNNCTFTTDASVANSASCRAISVGTNGNSDAKVKATITNTKIDMTGDNGWAVTAYGKDTTVDMTNVEIKTNHGGLSTNADKEDKVTWTCNNVTIDAGTTAAYFGAEGTYTLNNSTLEGVAGIEYTVGSLTLNNTKVTATGAFENKWALTPGENGNMKYPNTTDVKGGSTGFGSALKVKQLTANATKFATLEVKGNTKLVSEHGPALLVFSQGETVNKTKDRLAYGNSLSGYTKETTPGSPLVYAEKKAAQD